MKNKVSLVTFPPVRKTRKASFPNVSAAFLGNPLTEIHPKKWIPAFAGMTPFRFLLFKKSLRITSMTLASILVVHVCFAASDDTAGVSFVSSGLLFKPLVANTFEPRVGFFSEVNDNLFRLDIGNSIDLLHYRFSSERADMALGMDFFTYTQLRGERHFHFPVNTVDYFFGINVSGEKELSCGMVSARFRISHISAHFVDGHYDGTLASWRDRRYPIVYSREFLDPVISFEPKAVPSRVYAGATYLFHVDPAWLPKLSGYAGAEFYVPSHLSLTPYIAYQATFMKIYTTAVRHNVQAGIKIGEFKGRSLDIFLSYFSGYSIHGEYFDVQEKYTALGFLINF
ncbi:MAG: DUF1207 domain-containing protein [Bacteroidota bacterium]|nr:DUF1207 domain-containing protein [Bacteroidota bacterium]